MIGMVLTAHTQPSADPFNCCQVICFNRELIAIQYSAAVIQWAFIRRFKVKISQLGTTVIYCIYTRVCFRTLLKWFKVTSFFWKLLTGKRKRRILNWTGDGTTDRNKIMLHLSYISLNSFNWVKHFIQKKRIGCCTKCNITLSKYNLQ